MEKIHVGANLAEIDLNMRGAGEIFGLKQSGFENFKIADFSDRQSITAAQLQAQKVIESDPDLKKHLLLKEKISTLSEQYSEPN